MVCSPFYPTVQGLAQTSLLLTKCFKITLISFLLSEYSLHKCALHRLNLEVLSRDSHLLNRPWTGRFSSGVSINTADRLTALSTLSLALTAAPKLSPQISVAFEKDFICEEVSVKKALQELTFSPLLRFLGGIFLSPTSKCGACFPFLPSRMM